MDMDALAQEYFACGRILNRGPIREARASSEGELCVLGYLSEAQGETTPTGLSEEFRISTARVANVLNSLERKGYVRRERSLEDRRRVYLHITEAGRALARREKEDALACIRGMLTDLGEADAAEYVRISKRIVSLIQAREALLSPGREP